MASKKKNKNSGSAFWLRGRHHQYYDSFFDDESSYMPHRYWGNDTNPLADMWKERKESMFKVGSVNVFELARLRSAVANFVRIFTGKNVAVNFTSEMSTNYTDGKSIVLSSRIETGDLDVNVGLALHEASHIVWTDFEPLTSVFNMANDVTENGGDKVYGFDIPMDAVLIKKGTIERNLKNLSSCIDSSVLALAFLRHAAIKYKASWTTEFENIARSLVDATKTAGTPKLMRRMFRDWASNAIVFERAIKTGMDSKTAIASFNSNYSVHDDFSMIFGFVNLLEDIRIDSLAKRHAPGYVVYYDALEEHVFNHENINKIPVATRFKLETNPSSITIGDYLRSVCALHVGVPDADVSMLPNLNAIWTEIQNAKPHEMASTFEVLRLADRVLKLVCEGIETLIVDESNRQGGGGNGEDSNTVSYVGAADDSDPDIDRVNRFLTNSYVIRGSDDLLGDNLITMVNAAGATSISRVKIDTNGMCSQDEKPVNHDKDGSVPDAEYYCEVVENITDALITSGAGVSYGLYPTVMNNLLEPIRRGVVEGRKLARSLTIRNEALNTIVPNLKNGKLDKRKLAGAGYGDPNLFYNQTISKYQNAVIHISIDTSASMQNARIESAVEMAMTLAYGLSVLNGVRLQVSSRTTHKNNIPFIAVFYDSKRDSLVDLERRIKHLYAPSSTPEALCYDAVRMLLNRCNEPLKYFITITDGEPASYLSDVNGNSGVSFGGKTALEYGLKMQRKMQRDGIVPIGYFVDGKFNDETRKNLVDNFIDLHFIQTDSGGFRKLVRDVNGMLRKGGWC